MVEQTPERILRGEDEIRRVVLLSKSERERRQKAGSFPPYLRFGERARGLLESDALTWQRWQLECNNARATGLPMPPAPKWRVALPPPRPEMRRNGRAGRTR